MDDIAIHADFYITEAQMLDMLVTAVEGGTNRWLCLERVPYTLAPETLATIPRLPILVFDEYDEWTCYELTWDVMINGMQIMAEKYPHRFADVIMDDHDADTADVWMQCCLLGDYEYC